MADNSVKIYVVEDNDWYNRLLVHTLSLNPDYEVKSFFNGRDFLNSLHEPPDIVTLDYRLPDFTGTELLKQIKQEHPDITGYSHFRTGRYQYGGGIAETGGQGLHHQIE